MPQLHQSTLRLADFFQSASGHSKISFRPSTALCRSFAKFRSDEAFFFKALQCGINAADGHVTTGAPLKFGNRDAIRVIANADEGKLTINSKLPSWSRLVLYSRLVIK